MKHYTLRFSMIEIIDNFLSKSYHEELLALMDSPNFDWYYNSNISYENVESGLDEFGFTHVFWDADGARMNATTAFWKPSLLQMMDALNAKTILRSRGDMTLYCNTESIHAPHVDFTTPHISSVFYVNDSDGDTIFYNGDQDKLEVLKRVSPKANRLVFFDGLILHTGSSPKKHKNRIIINSNFEI